MPVSDARVSDERGGDARVRDVFDALPARRGHFVLESGYHTDLWLTLDALFVDPAALAPHVVALAEQLRAHAPTAICGPLFGGAFLAQAIASQLGLKFFVVEPAPPGGSPDSGLRSARTGAADGLFTARYRLPAGQRALVRGERVAVVDDVISAGSSVRAAIAALTDDGAAIAAVGALLVFGDTALAHFAAQRVPVEALALQALAMWAPDACALCRAGVPLEHP
jgi:orotate phosphoribosyltransferase